MDRLEKNEVEVSHDWQSEDFSPLGRGTSQRQVQKAISYAALRYNRELHVSNDRLDRVIDKFAQKQVRYIEEELQKIEAKALDDSMKINKESSIKESLEKENYKNGEFFELKKLLTKLYNENVEKDMSSETVEFYKTVFPNLSGLIEEKEFAKVSVVRLTGNAGMGKTHYLCATAERLCKTTNVYLLFW